MGADSENPSSIQRPASIVFYLPRRPGSYGNAFAFQADEAARDFGHDLWIRQGMSIISPVEISLEVFHPRNFLKIRDKWSATRIWLVDRVRGPLPLIQIVDHRNLSGQNPLRGETPMGHRPRFPDVSRLYLRSDLGLPRGIVTTVGPERFHEEEINEGSEVSALVALSADYAGLEVVGIGWNDHADPNGELLGHFVEEAVNRGRSP